MDFMELSHERAGKKASDALPDDSASLSLMRELALASLGRFAAHLLTVTVLGAIVTTPVKMPINTSMGVKPVSTV